MSWQHEQMWWSAATDAACCRLLQQTSRLPGQKLRQLHAERRILRHSQSTLVAAAREHCWMVASVPRQATLSQVIAPLPWPNEPPGIAKPVLLSPSCGAATQKTNVWVVAKGGL